MKKTDLLGQRFKRLVVIKEVGSNKNGRVIWLCKCDCGNYHETLGKYLRDGSVTSCGCRRREILKNQSESSVKHRMVKTKLYHTWTGMRKRCNNPNDSSYPNYGGRGIKVCEEWNEFLNFYNWAMSSGYNENLTIDRINNNGNYEPDNCRWATYKIQGNNNRHNHYLTYKGMTKTMSEWSEITGINYRALRSRINTYHWSVDKALETPVRKIKRKIGVSA